MKNVYKVTFAFLLLANTGVFIFNTIWHKNSKPTNLEVSKNNIAESSDYFKMNYLANINHLSRKHGIDSFFKIHKLSSDKKYVAYLFRSTECNTCIDYDVSQMLTGLRKYPANLLFLGDEKVLMSLKDKWGNRIKSKQCISITDSQIDSLFHYRGPTLLLYENGASLYYTTSSSKKYNTTEFVAAINKEWMQ